MSKLQILKSVLATLVRGRAPLEFGDLGSLEPISRKFGIERGTPIDRHYIHRYLKDNSDAISGRALEVGELKYLSEFGSNVTRSSILTPAEPSTTGRKCFSNAVIGDLTKQSELPTGQFDCFLCTQTLNVIYDVDAAIRGAYQLLDSGGILLGTVPGISQISRYDMDRWGDHWRFTTCSIERVLREVFGPNVSVQSFGNVIAAQALLLGAALEDLPNPDLLDTCDNDYQVIIGFRAQKQ